MDEEPPLPSTLSQNSLVFLAAMLACSAVPAALVALYTAPRVLNKKSRTRSGVIITLLAVTIAIVTSVALYNTVGHLRALQVLGSPFAILGLPEGASPSDVKSAYRRLAMVHHPDRGGTDAAFQRLSRAYAILSDPAARAAYEEGAAHDDDEAHDRSPPLSEPGMRKVVLFVYVGVLFVCVPLCIFAASRRSSSASGGGGGDAGAGPREQAGSLRAFHRAIGRKRGGVDDADDAVDLGLTVDTADIDDDEDFFVFYSAAFARNARFAAARADPLPSLGGPDDDVDTVRAFYAAWRTFESERPLREIPGEKAPAFARRRRAETARVISLVAAAEERDPRLARVRAAEAEAAKRAKYAARAAARGGTDKDKGEAAAARAAARAAAAEAAAREEAIRKALAPTASALLRAALAKADPAALAAAGVSREETEAALDDGRLDAVAVATACLRDRPRASSTGGSSVHSTDRGNGEGDEARQPSLDVGALAAAMAEVSSTASSKSAPAAALPPAPWDPILDAALLKAMVRFPGGARNRWASVAAALNAGTPFTSHRTPAECIARATVLAEGPRGGAPTVVVPFAVPAPPPAAAAPPVPADDGAEAWTAAQQEALEAALKRHPPAASGGGAADAEARWNAIAADVPGKTRKQCVARFKALRDVVLKAQQAGTA